MTPTAKFRWLELPLIEQVGHKHPSSFVIRGRVRVLQQWWENEYYAINGGIEGEWRDIPVEEQA